MNTHNDNPFNKYHMKPHDLDNWWAEIYYDPHEDTKELMSEDANETFGDIIDDI